MNYAEFIDKKTQLADGGGFEPLWIPDFLFDFQRAMVEFAIRGGRKALLEDCGLGKSPQELVWAQNVHQYTNKPVLIATPLGVTSQLVREGEKFGIECHRSRDGENVKGIVITNYERLHKFNSSDFAGMVCDESSILKSSEGETRAAVTDFMRKMPYRLLGTATAAPNDYVELGTSSEALGYLGHMDMLNRFFKNQNNTSDTKGHWRGKGAARVWEGKQWRFKGHAERPFWRWVCSWARSLRKPSDIGFDDGKFQLPPLEEREHVVKARAPRDGMLFSVPAVGLAEEREDRRRTLKERCEMAAELLAGTGQPGIAWCHLNPEGDLLERLIPGAIQVSGKDSDEAKEEKLAAFASGQARVMVIKPIIGAWGLNWQHCAHMTSFGSHSFEQYYQSVRRCWRFGQTRRVVVDHVISDGEQRVLENLNRKAVAADLMFSEMTAHMKDELGIARSREYTEKIEVPSWI